MSHKSYIAGTNGSFVKDTTRVVFVCLGLLLMLVVFSIAASFSTVSSSSTISYLKSLFESDNTKKGNNNEEKSTTTNNKDANTKPDEKEQQKSIFTKVSDECKRLFAQYSSYMISLCVIALLLLLILQNTIANLSDERFLVYYLLASFVTTTYGTIEYKAYLILSWSLWVLWNILAIGMAYNILNMKQYSLPFLLLILANMYTINPLFFLLLKSITNTIYSIFS